MRHALRSIPRAAPVAAIALLAAAAPAGPARADDEPTRVWLDVDPANGIGEIDDGLALIQAFQAPELDVAGVSTVFGNAEQKHAHAIATNVVRVFGPDGLEVRAGAAGPADRGAENEAVAGMAEALRDGPVTLLALGPVTNVATLLQRHPDLAERLERIVVVAGRRSPEQRFVSSPEQPHPFRDFNVILDPASMRVLVDSEVPLVLAPWEVSSDVWLTRDDLDALRASGGSGLWIAATSQQWIDAWEQELNAKGGNPFDTLAVGWLTHPELIEGTRVTARIVDADEADQGSSEGDDGNAGEAGSSDGEGPPDQQPHADRAAGPDEGDPPGEDGAGERRGPPWLVVDPVDEDADPDRSVRYLHTADAAFHDVLLQRLAGPEGLPGE